MTTSTVLKCFLVFALVWATIANTIAIMNINKSATINACLDSLDSGSDYWYSDECQELDKKYGGKVIINGVEQK